MKEVDWCWESIVFKLFTLAGNRNAKVSEVWDSSLGQGGWNLRLARDFNDWELEQIGNMLNLLKDFRTSTEEDAVRWKRESNGVFGAKGAYKILLRGGRSSPWISFKEGGGSSLTGVFCVDVKRRVANHIMLHCTVVKTLWEIALAIFGVQWVFPESVIEVLLSWRDLCGEKKEKTPGIPFRCAFFGRFGRKGIDLLNKDYNFDHKFTLLMQSPGGMGVTATGWKKDQIFFGDVSTLYKSGNTTVDLKLDTHSNVSTKVTAHDILPCTKVACSFKIPDHKSGKLDVQYLHPHAAIDSSIGLNPTPLLELSAAIGSKDLSLGGEVGLNTASASFTKYNAGIALTSLIFQLQFC
ncbi:Mitochondrial outer membrane protein porin 4 [Vitis vinifera]|uniref:Mitochondrial outer membrane protein porin 4 n=1 Tax=Vitis vinifera TaxID=29760 RepID=A0A438GTH4_VITVI|nr:Mitochondrial outer membrane protein porin 4 [Vitis vinifera]